MAVRRALQSADFRDCLTRFGMRHARLRHFASKQSGDGSQTGFPGKAKSVRNTSLVLGGFRPELGEQHLTDQAKHRYRQH